MKVTLFVPILNEIHGLQNVMPRVDPSLFCQILVVDGGSKDGSADFARSKGWDVVDQKKKGLRYAYIEGFPHIKGDYVLTFSPDGNCKPEDMPKILNKLSEGYDMVIGSRYFDGAHSDDDNWLTGFGNWLFTKIINILHGGNYSDSLGIFRAYRTKLFYELDMHKDESYAGETLFFTICGVEPLLSVRAAKRKIKHADVGSDEPARLGGVRKLQVFRWGGTQICQIIRELYYWR